MQNDKVFFVVASNWSICTCSSTVVSGFHDGSKAFCTLVVTMKTSYIWCWATVYWQCSKKRQHTPVQHNVKNSLHDPVSNQFAAKGLLILITSSSVVTGLAHSKPIIWTDHMLTRRVMFRYRTIIVLLLETRISELGISWVSARGDYTCKTWEAAAAWPRMPSTQRSA